MQNTNYPPVPAFEVIGNVLPTLKPFLSRPENAKVIRQALEDSKRFFLRTGSGIVGFCRQQPLDRAGTLGNPVEGERDSGGKANNFFWGGLQKPPSSIPLCSYPVKTDAKVLIAKKWESSLHRGQKRLCHELPGLVIHFQWPGVHARLVG